MESGVWWRGIALGACTVLGACAGGAGEGSSFGGEDGGGFAPPLPDGATVGFLETPLPNDDAFVLHGTLPVPPRTFPRADGQDPFTVLDYDGTPLPTQTEVVTRYPHPDDGADVVEVIARVQRDPALGSSTYARYEVVQQPRSPLPAPGTADVGDLVNATADLPASLTGLLSDPLAIEIIAYDCFGNAYAFAPLDGSGWMRLERYGVAQTELRVYDNLRPAPSVSGPSGTLPHFLGAHAYLSTFSGEEFARLDLRLHNGHSGRDGATDQDDPLDRVYFERIDVVVPDGWRLHQNFEDPLFGGFVTQGGRRVYSLVAPNADGSMHVMRWQGQFLRRLVVAPDGGGGRARDRLRGTGQAFCVRGTDPVRGHEYWSWWNRGTARYFPQSYVLPTLDHLGIPVLRGLLRNEHDFLEAHLEQGTGVGDYPVSVGNLGWGHPYGVSYGGMTGGAEIFLIDGVTVAASASIRGLRAYQALHRMHTDRQPTAFYDADGEPTSVERWLVSGGSNGDYVPFLHFLHPTLGPGDPFGFDQAPQFQIQFVQGNGLAPGYESAHLGFDPHDYQHFIRYTRAPKVLVWLSNDSLAADDLRMQAENFHLSYHPHANTASGMHQSSGMRGAIESVATYPGAGFAFGRGESWGFDCALAAYAVGDDAWRARKLSWFRRLALLVSDGQVACSGFLQAQVTAQFANGQYRGRQAIEESIAQNMLQGVRQTVLRDFDRQRSELVRGVLERSLFASVSDMAWFPGETAPWARTGIGPADPSTPVWCSLGQMPPDAYLPYHERFQNASPLAYGYELTGNPLFLEKARLLIGDEDLVNGLQNHGLENLENRAALLALAQHLFSEF